ncbi:type ISP restriction/modification enzyme, partial [Geminocystis sp. GBBB08]|uniref:type ISP restriction/modification enzyme n=1 Tax=Geminocystis sp. GBBB08 TaxID=2604140 RepID=UPI0027E267E0
TAVLIQNGDESLRIDMENDDELDKLINQFLDYERAEIKDFRQAINTFSQDLPTILNTLRNLIDSQDTLNSDTSGKGLKPIVTNSGKPIPLPKVKLKADKINGKIIIDEITILENIPPLAWEYKLGNRSALEWILDQYKEKKPKDKTIAEKFNNYRFADYKEQVIDLLTRVTTVSIETMKIINQMNL